ncbi:hypothetical protein ABZ540_05030 [Nocardia xishanensis]|uniref:hypothetical protein n=1 Tax=Nocardia xishanensis TaxID=238964 RepID=UPI00340CF3E4
MDPVTLIAAALAAGAAASLQESATDAVRSLYAGLKDQVARLFARRPGGELILTRHEEQPDVWRGPLEAELAAADAAKDVELVRKAQELMALLLPEEAEAGRFQIAVAGDVQGLVQGNSNQVSMTFGQQPPSGS